MSKPARTIAELPQNTRDKALENIIRQFLSCFGEDPDRAELANTPARARALWQHWLGGARVDSDKTLSAWVRANKSASTDMVCLAGVGFYSHREADLAPFAGRAWVAYVPGERLVEAARLADVVDVFARRLQTPERLAGNIADSLMRQLKPAGVGVVLEIVTDMSAPWEASRPQRLTALRGCVKESAPLRGEFLSQIS